MKRFWRSKGSQTGKTMSKLHSHTGSSKKSASDVSITQQKRRLALRCISFTHDDICFFNLQNQQFDPLPHFCSGLVIDSPNFDRGMKGHAFFVWLVVSSSWSCLHLFTKKSRYVNFWRSPYDSDLILGFLGKFPHIFPMFLRGFRQLGQAPDTVLVLRFVAISPKILDRMRSEKNTRNIPRMVVENVVSCCF